jgi:hypothetical protein
VIGRPDEFARTWPGLHGDPEFGDSCGAARVIGMCVRQECALDRHATGSRSDSVDQFALFKTAAGVDQPASLVIV